MTTWQANLSLLLVSAIWGSSFVVVKEAVETVPPLLFVALRFWVGAAALAVVYWRALRSSPGVWRAGSLVGMLLFASFALQTFGLQTTTSAKAGFITGLSVVMVPIGSAILLRRPPRSVAVAGVALATIGLALLSVPDSLTPGLGDLLVLGCAFGFAAHILALGALPRGYHPGVLATAQLVASAISATVLVALLPDQRAPVSGSAWVAVLSMGLLATAGAYLIQTIAQRYTSPTDTALIFMAEPVFAALFAYFWRGETLQPRAWFGATLILAGMALAQLEVQVHAARVARHLLRGLQLLAFLVRTRGG